MLRNSSARKSGGPITKLDLQTYYMLCVKLHRFVGHTWTRVTENYWNTSEVAKVGKNLTCITKNTLWQVFLSKTPHSFEGEFNL